MRLLSTAILAVLLLITPLRADTPIHPPIKVQFRLADGMRISGTLSSWNHHSFDGSFGARNWSAIHPDDIWSLYRRVMDQSSSEDWINLGRLLLLVPDSPRSALQNANAAFRKARELAPDSAPAAIQSVVDELHTLQQAASQTHQAALDQQLRSISPEGAHYPSAPWPALSRDDQIAALADVLLRAQTMLSSQGLSLKTLQTPYFLLYSDLPENQLSTIAADLDRAYLLLARLFQLPENDNIYYGKAVLFIFRDPDRFRLVETSLFQQLSPKSITAVCHPADPDYAAVFICATCPDASPTAATVAPPVPASQPASVAPSGADAPVYQPGDSSISPPTSPSIDPDLYRAAIVRQTAFAFLHRYRSPRRLPAWANEGLAWWVAHNAMKSSPIEVLLRANGRSFIRSSGRVADIFDVTYSDLLSVPFPGTSDSPQPIATSMSPPQPPPADAPGRSPSHARTTKQSADDPRKQIQRSIAAANLHPVSYLAVSLMLDDNPRAFARWVNAVKSGSQWESALGSAFGASPAQLAEIVAQYFRVNE